MAPRMELKIHTLLVVVVVIVTTVFSVAAAVGEKERRSDDVNDLAVVVERLSQDLGAVQGQLTVQNNQLDAQRLRIAQLEAANNHTIAFSAYISDEPNIQASAGSTVPFRGVITNAGDAYNPSTSAFTAPRPGQYFFIVHADCSPDYRSLVVNRNGHRVFGADNDGGQDHHVTGSGLMTLQAGDVVTTSHYSSAGVVDAGNESTFTGFWVK